MDNSPSQLGPVSPGKARTKEMKKQKKIAATFMMVGMVDSINLIDSTMSEVFAKFAPFIVKSYVLSIWSCVEKTSFETKFILDFEENGKQF